MQSSEAIKYHTYKFLILGFVSILLLFADRRVELTSLRTALSIAVYPIQYVIDIPSRVTHAVGGYFQSHQTLLKENKELNRLVMVYSAKDQNYRSIFAENARLRDALKMGIKSERLFMISHVLSLQAERFQRASVLNQGTNAGVFDGQVALSGSGIYGQVIETTPQTAVILQLADPKHTIPVRNSRTGATALAVGTGDVNTVRLTSIDEVENVEIGDLYLSSGLGQVFPSDYPVARVQQKRYNPADSMTIVTAKTVTNYSKVREVLLTWQPPASADEIQTEAGQ